MKRREFLAGAAAVAASTLSTFNIPVSARAVRQANEAKRDRISLMTLNFESLLKDVPDVQPNPNRTLNLFDLPTMLADTYGTHRVEFQHYHLASLEESYLKDLRKSLEKAKARAMQINLEFSGLNMSAPKHRDRLLAIDLTKQFIDHAVTLGALRVMVNQGAQSGTDSVMPTHVNKAYGIPTLKTMADYGKSKGIIVSIETRGGGGGGGGRRAAAPGAAGAAATPPAAPAAPPPGTPANSPEVWALLSEILQGAGAKSNVDVGGAAAANQEELHACLKMMRPFTAGTMHTRLGGARWDLATAIKYLEKDLDWHGLYTIESGGHAGTKAVYDVVLATL